MWVWVLIKFETVIKKFGTEETNERIDRVAGDATLHAAYAKNDNEPVLRYYKYHATHPCWMGSFFNIAWSLIIHNKIVIQLAPPVTLII